MKKGDKVVVTVTFRMSGSLEFPGTVISSGKKHYKVSFDGQLSEFSQETHYNKCGNISCRPA